VVAEDTRLERIALLVQKQLFDIGIDMQVQLVPLRQLASRVAQSEFEAALLEFTPAKSLSYLYFFWHSPQPGVPVFINSGYSSADGPLDRLRAAISEAEIRAAVTDVQRTFYEDPPALFLVWTETARALSRSFAVPDEGQRDILATISQWRPVTAPLSAQR
jgi:ABC-type transport system substrate-binding protein